MANSLSRERSLEKEVEELKREIASLKEAARASRDVERELRQSRQMLQLVMDNIPHIVFWKNRDSVYLGCNQNYARLAGLERPEDVAGKVDFDLPWSREESEWYRKCDAQVMGTGEAWLNIIESTTTAQGGQIWAVTNKVPLRGESGEIIGLLGTSEDVTERMMMEKELREKNAALERQAAALEKVQRELLRANEELEERVQNRTRHIEQQRRDLGAALAELRNAQQQLIHSEKMGSLGRLTAKIAHELKNPLNFVINFSEIADEFIQELTEIFAAWRGEVPAEAAKVLVQIQDNMRRISEHGLRANSIVQTMLMHSRNASGERQATHLHTLLQECFQLAYHSFRSQEGGFELTLHTELEPSIGEMSLVRESISRAYLNLISNACDSIREAQRRWPGLRPPELKISTRRLAGAVEVRIRDNGMGVPEEHRKRIFEPFFTTKPQGEGVGLGLSLCYDIIVKEHGGTILLESEEGVYAELITTLPLQ